MSSYKTLPTPGDTAWFTHDRFGMFIHFGLYAMPARHEWVKNYEEIPEDHYDLYFKHFNPDLYDPKEWARQAKAAGMKYVVMTTKHHEGFCLFDSKYTDYKSTNTLCGKDLIREYVDAFRAEGLHIGFYYSLIDWHHPEFPIDPLHPRRDDPDAYEQSKGRDIKKYAQYMRDQVTELLTNYGKIDILWFDFSYSQNNGTGDKAWQKGKGKDDWEAEKLIATARALQPHIIIDNRTEIDQDLWTPEQYEPDQWVRDKKNRRARYLGSLPHLFRLLGIFQRRTDLEISRNAHSPARQHRFPRRQPADERRPHLQRLSGLPRGRSPEGIR